MTICIVCTSCLPSFSWIKSETSIFVIISFIMPVLFFWFIFNPSLENRHLETKRLKRCANGTELLLQFCVSTVITIATLICHHFYVWFPSWKEFTQYKLTIRAFTFWDYLKYGPLSSIIVATIALAMVFWCGIIRVYVSSEQLGIRYRVLGLLFGMIPIANLIMLGKIISVCREEVRFEQDRLVRDKERHDKQICKTKYPILMVHGVFFRDFRASYLNYWGRIPEALKNNGATIYYGNQESAGSVAFCGEQIKKRIEELVSETGCEKINVIAHSKGGLDTRHAIKLMGDNPLVASLTTVNTPHRGCHFAEYLLEKIPANVTNAVAEGYNKALYTVGDNNPDFIKAVSDLTASKCEEFNKVTPDSDKVYYQSVGSKLNHAVSGRFPLNYSYHIVKHFDGANDGLVGEKSFPWGENFQYLTVKGRRGISHGDMIDLNRENIKGFDVREFYIQLVSDLREKGF